MCYHLYKIKAMCVDAHTNIHTRMCIISLEGQGTSGYGDCSHDIKRHLLHGRKVLTNLLLLLSHFSHVRLCVTP